MNDMSIFWLLLKLIAIVGCCIIALCYLVQRLNKKKSQQLDEAQLLFQTLATYCLCIFICILTIYYVFSQLLF